MSARSGERWEGAGVCRNCGKASVSIALVTCPECGGPIGAEPASGAVPLKSTGWFDVPPMIYQSAYVWFLLVSAIDLVLTAVILIALEGTEVNPIADAVIGHTGFTGLILFKFALVVFVVVMCEWIGRRNRRAGARLSEWAVALTAIPVVASLVQIFTHG